jgi:hypothetical protein
MKMTPDISLNFDDGRHDDNASYCRWYPETVSEKIRIINNFGINKNTHPNIVDLFSGTGGVLEIFEQYGWEKEHLIAIDWYEYKNPYKLVICDLIALVKNIQADIPIQEDIEKYKKSFDIVTIFFPIALDGRDIMRSNELFILARYFLKQDGIVFAAGRDPEEDEEQHWAKYEYVPLYRKLY